MTRVHWLYMALVLLGIPAGLFAAAFVYDRADKHGWDEVATEIVAALLACMAIAGLAIMYGLVVSS